MERETFTSTKLQLRVYTDSQCSQAYDDGQSTRTHATKGYKVGNRVIPSKVSFRPPFYSCLTCAPQQVSNTFNKKFGNWYDDDYINGGNRNKQNQNNNNNNNNGDDANGDDQYRAANDDINGGGGNRRVLAAPEENIEVRIPIHCFFCYECFTVSHIFT
jgi:hypothetical protein